MYNIEFLTPIKRNIKQEFARYDYDSKTMTIPWFR